MKIKSLLSLFLFLCSLGALRAQVIFSEGFNVTTTTNTPPTGWTVNTSGSTNGCTTADWAQVVSGGFVCSTTFPYPNPTPNSGSGMAGYNSWDIYYGSWSDLSTPAIALPALGTYSLSFYVYETWNFTYDSLKVYINSSPTSVGATLLADYTPDYFPPGYDSWSQYTLNIPNSYAGTNVYFIFRGVSSYGADIFFDDVAVTRTPPTPCSGTPGAPTITTPPMTTPICGTGSRTISATDPNLPTTSGITYQWETASSASGPWTPVAGATSLNYTTPTLTTSAWYRLALTCAATPATVYSGIYLVQLGAPQPGPMSGPPTICSGDPATFSVPAVAGSTYNWILPTGWTGTSTTNSITVTPTAAGTISVTARDGCGTSIPRSLTVNTGSAPAPPAKIVGNALFCVNTPQTYSVPAVNGATSYIWTLPSGWTGTSTTNTINATATTATGNVTVKAVNGCGQSAAAVLAVSSINALDPVGQIFGKDTLCPGNLQTYYINPVPGATSYTWTLPTGWSGTTTDTLIKVFAGQNDGTLSVTANVSCAASTPNTKTIKVLPAVVPTVSLSAQAGTLCAGQVITISAAATGAGTAPVYQWFKNGLPIPNTGSQYQSNSLVNGDVLQVTLSSSERCASPGQVSSNMLAPVIVPAPVQGINIDMTPGTPACTHTMLEFSANTNGADASTQYQWMQNSTAIPGASGTTYSSSSLSDGDTIYAVMSSTMTCAQPGGTKSNRIVLSIRDTLVPDVTIAASPGNVIDAGDEITFTASPINGGATPSYQWFRNGVIIPYETNSTYKSSTLRPGDHISVRMLSYLECAYPRVVMSSDITMTAYDLSVGSQGSAGTFKCYPNPSQGSLRIKGDLSGLGTVHGIRVEILNPIGQIVYRIEVPASGGAAWETSINLPAQLANGQYLLQLRSTGDGQPIQAVKSFQLIR